MESRKIKNANIGGDLGAAAEEVIEQQKTQSQVPQGTTMLNPELLPSKGLYYKTPLYISELSPMDLKNLNQMNEENANQVINTVLSNCVHGINYKDLLQGDKVWLLFYIRSVTYDDFPLFIKYTCSECKKVDTFKVRLGDLKVNYAKEDFEPLLELKKSGDTLTLRYPTLRLEERVQNLAKNDQIIEAIDPELAEIALYIEKVNGKDVTPLESYNYVKNMKAVDFVEFSNYMIENNIGLVPIMDIPCTCGNIVKRRIGFTPDFFFPDFKKYQNA